MASLISALLSGWMPSLSDTLTANFPDLQTSAPGPTQDSKDAQSVDQSPLYRWLAETDPSLQSFTGMPYTERELSLDDVPEQTVETCNVVEYAALLDLIAVEATNIDQYRAHLLKQITDKYDPAQNCHSSWAKFFAHCLKRDRASYTVIPEHILKDVEEKAELPRVSQAFRVILRATRRMTDEQMSGVWHGPQYNEMMRYLQRASQVLKVYCTYHAENTPGKFLHPVPEAWFGRKSE
jgi:hypothetical protein